MIALLPYSLHPTWERQWQLPDAGGTNSFDRRV